MSNINDHIDIEAMSFRFQLKYRYALPLSKIGQFLHDWADLRPQSRGTLCL